jgi:hypothetical protein
MARLDDARIGDSRLGRLSLPFLRGEEQKNSVRGSIKGREESLYRPKAQGGVEI